MAYRSLTQLAHAWIVEKLEGILKDRSLLQQSFTAVDATAGNGHDTLFLANLLGPHGVVHTFDIQEEAIQKTRQLVIEEQLLSRIRFHHASHSEWQKKIPSQEQQVIFVAMMNLGYLPGGDKSITTTGRISSEFFRQITEQLHGDGVMTVLAYRGHPGGSEEFELIHDAFTSLDDMQFSKEMVPATKEVTSPVLFRIQKRQL